MTTRFQRTTSTAGALVMGVGLLGALASPAAASTHRPHPHVLLIGGNLKENAEILTRLVARADPDGSGPRRARIAIVSAAAGAAATPEEAADDSLNNAAANGLYYSALFQRFGADTYAVPVDTAVDYVGDAYVPANAYSPEVAAQVRASTGVFFGGGDQMDYVRTLLSCPPAPDEAADQCTDTPVLSAVRAVVQRGGVVSGVSAGLTFQQGRDMVTGGESYQGWRDGSAPGYFDDATKLSSLPAGGAGFVPNVLLDSHFTTWGREARIVRLALDTGHARALGVDETTALDIDSTTGKADVLGVNGVSLLDLSAAVDTGSGVTGVRWTYLTRGDRLDLDTWRVHPATGAVAVHRSGAAPGPVGDVWDSIDGRGGSYTLRDLARALVRSSGGQATGASFEDAPRFTTTLATQPRTRAWDTVGGTSFSGLELRIGPGGDL